MFVPPHSLFRTLHLVRLLFFCRAGMHADAFVGPCYIFTERYVSVGVVYATFRAVMSFGRLLTLLFRCTKF